MADQSLGHTAASDRRLKYYAGKVERRALHKELKQRIVGSFPLVAAGRGKWPDLTKPREALIATMEAREERAVSGHVGTLRGVTVALGLLSLAISAGIVSENAVEPAGLGIAIELTQSNKVLLAMFTGIVCLILVIASALDWKAQGVANVMGDHFVRTTERLAIAYRMDFLAEHYALTLFNFEFDDLAEKKILDADATYFVDGQYSDDSKRRRSYWTAQIKDVKQAEKFYSNLGFNQKTFNECRDQVGDLLENLSQKFDLLTKELDRQFVLDEHGRWLETPTKHGFWQYSDFFEPVFSAKQDAIFQLRMNDRHQRIDAAGDSRELHHETTNLLTINRSHRVWVNARSIAVATFPIVVGLAGSLTLWKSVL
ncbi:hypothetical protein [uncultured Roseobacter sp.]|uniref:hypothetical protein n=1 Tax=uncultured Roseobacter sp. TaxID=114847 RepID=UPI00261249FE|nr:hypothetical protein [uncultured Roseobacter sp.]